MFYFTKHLKPIMKNLTFAFIFCMPYFLNGQLIQVPIPQEKREAAIIEYQQNIQNEISLDAYLNIATRIYNEQLNVLNNAFCDPIIDPTGCNNGDFENGVFDPTVWQVEYGSITNEELDESTFLCGYDDLAMDRVSIVSAGEDETVGSLLLTVPNSPSPNNYSLKIGNSSVGNEAEMVTKTFQVDNSNFIVSFDYAVVLESPNHDDDEVPTFWVRVFDGDINQYVDGLVDLDGQGGDMIVADINNTVLFEAFGTGVVYTNWLCATINLQSLIGKTVTIEFINKDCSLGGHFGYTYLDNLCNGCGDSPTSLTFNTGNSSDCGIPAQLCLDYTIPTNGSIQIDLDIIQSGNSIGSLQSPVLNQGTQFCFDINENDLSNISSGVLAFQATGKFEATLDNGNTIPLPSQFDGIIDYPLECDDCVSPSFIKLYGDTINNYFRKVEWHEGAYYANGYRGTSDPDLQGVFIKMDLDGAIEWEVQLEAAKTINDFVKVNDGFLFVGGTRPYNGTARSLIGKIDNQGNLVWSKEYNFVNREFLSKIEKTEDSSEFYVLGSETNIGNCCQEDLILLRIDEDGNEIFRKRIDYQGEDEQLYSGFLRLQNGDYIVMGGKANQGQIGVLDASISNGWFSGEGGSGSYLYQAVEANDKVYVVGKTSTIGRILVLDNTGKQKLYRYNLPNISLAYRIAADFEGKLYVIGRGDIGDGIANRHVVYKLSELHSGNDSELSVEWVKFIDYGETNYAEAGIFVEDNRLIFQDSRLDHPNSFRNYDVLLGIFDLDMNGVCVIDTLNYSISSPVEVNTSITANFTITDQSFPTPTTFDLGDELAYNMAELYCPSVPCDGDKFCEIFTCSTDTLILNTGYDHTIDDVYPLIPGTFDSFWELVESPDNSISLPKPAYVISPHSAWANQSMTRWISAYQHSSLEDNNEPPLDPYTLQNCFCICQDSSEVEMKMNVYVDDGVTMNLVNEDGTLVTHLLDHIGFRSSAPPGIIDTTLTLPTGTYCINAEMRNLGRVVMGLNVQGYLTGASIVDAVCCGNTGGTIVGSKFHDRDCDGIRDNDNSPLSGNYEEGLEGWEISLCDVNEVVLQTTMTDQFGYYVFNDVPPGDYLVKETQQTDWEATNIESQTFHSISIDTAEVIGDLNFANKYNGPVEFDGEIGCIVPGETIPIRWNGGECDCNIILSYRSCNNPPGISGDIHFSPNLNTGGYEWDVPDDLPNGSYQIILEACDEQDSPQEIESQCFDVIDIDLSYTALVDICGEVVFSASSTPSGTYSWNFGDASPFGMTSSIVHQYDSEGPYTVTLTVTTMEGCQKSTSFTVEPENNILPNIVCPPDITIGINDPTDPSFTGMATGSDDCQLYVDIHYQEVILGSCPDGEINIIRAWIATNPFGLTDTCRQTITVECETTSTTVSGTALQPNGDPICEVMVIITGDVNDTTFTDMNGFYEFTNVPVNSNITITPILNEDHLCGVDQSDIDIIQNHIIGIQPLSTPFEYIAADVNNNGDVNSLDNFFINSLIMGSINSFPDNSSWRFVDANYVFPDPPLSSPFPEDVSLTPILGSQVVNFTGVKIGDVNNDCNSACDTCDLTINPIPLTYACYEEGAFVTVEVNGGILPLNYSWYTSQGLLFSNSEMGEVLNPGGYTIYVSDANGCIDSTEVIVNQAEEIFIDAMVTECTNGQNGIIDLSIASATPPQDQYYFNWSTGENTEDIAGLPAGTYTVTVTGFWGCTEILEISVDCICDLSANTIASNANCFGSNDGGVSTTINGGIQPYTFIWSNGANTSSLTAVGAGTYTVTITDANNCATTSSVTIAQPSAPLTVSAEVTNTSCNNPEDGAIVLTVSGGTFPYTYLWDIGFQSEIISNIPADIYSVTITDANGCTLTQEYIVGTEVCPCNGEEEITITGELIGCDNIEFTAVANGFTNPVTYAWTGMGGASPISPNSMTTQIVYDGTIPEVTLCVEVTDNICTVDSCYTFAIDFPAPEFLTCPGNINFATEIDDCFSNSNVSELIALSGCNNVPVSVNCVRSDDSNLTLSDPWPIGVTTVTCTATDDTYGVSSVCEFTVTVVDNSPPILNCPSDIILPCTSNQNGVLYDFDLSNSAIDNCSNQLTITCSHPSGTIFPIGTTTVTCVAMDASGNESMPCSFNVTVEECLSACCLDTIGFDDRFDAGFFTSNQSCDVFIDPMELDSCDQLSIDWGDMTTSVIQGVETTSHTYSASGDYQICITAFMLAADGSVCHSRELCIDVCVECDGCDNPMITKEWTRAIPDILPSQGERGFGMTHDSNSDMIYISGGFEGNADFGNVSLMNNGKTDIFWAKYNSNGDIYEAFSAGGDEDDYATAIVVDDEGLYCVAGIFHSEEITLPSAGPNPSITLTESRNIFIAKYSATNNLLWAKNFGKWIDHTTTPLHDLEELRDITIDPQGNIILVGRTKVYPVNFSDDPNDILPAPNLTNGFIVKLDPLGNHLWSLPIGGTGVFENDVKAVRTDSNGDIYVTGSFGGEVNFNPLDTVPIGRAGSCLNCKGSATNMFTAKYNSSGILQWVVNAGAPTSLSNIPNGIIQGHDLIIQEDEIWGVGQLKGTDINLAPLNTVGINLSTDQHTGGFLAKYNSSNGQCEWAHGLNLNGKILGVDLDPQGNIGIAGFFNRNNNMPLDFDPSPSEEFLLASSNKDGFIAKYNPAGQFITAFNIIGNGGDELQDIAFDDDGKFYTIGYHHSSNLDDDPVWQTNSLLNSGQVPDIFFGKYGYGCTTVDTDCCEDIEATLESLGTCCYSLDLVNNYGFSITEIEIIINTPDVLFNVNSVPTGYQFNVVTDDLISITHSSGSIPSGDISDVFNFCLAATEGSNPPNIQDLTIRWLGQTDMNGTPLLLCEETETTNCDFIDSESCVLFSDPIVACSDESDFVYTLDFTVTNLSDVQADAMVLNGQTPGFTFTECFVPSIFSETNIIHSFGDPLLPDETSDNICLKIVSPELLQDSTEVCFTLSLEGGSGDETCCSEVIEYCVMLAPCCDACDETEVIVSDWQNSTGECCYEIDISNNCAVNFFSAIELSIETGDVSFGSIQNGGGGNWAFTAHDQQNMTWFPRGFTIPTGLDEDVIKFCLSGSTEETIVNVNWMVRTDDINVDSIYCTDELILQCTTPDTNACLNVLLDTITCDTILGVYNMTLQIENSSDFNASQINIISPPGVYPIGGGIIPMNPALGIGEIREVEVSLFPDSFPFDQSDFEFNFSIKETFGDTCCQEFDQLIVPVPDCFPIIDSVDDLFKENQFKVFPNPFTDGFTVLFDDPLDESLEITIWDIYGRRISFHKIGIGEKRFQLSLENMASGVYLLQLMDSNNKSLSRKLIKH